MTHKQTFIISHLLFLVSLIVISNIPSIYPVINERFLPPMGRYLRFYIIGVLSITFFAYYLLLRFYKTSDLSLFKTSAFSVYFWTSTIVVFLILCKSKALLSHDLYEYSIRGRMLTIYGMNPYLHVPTEINSDMYFPFIFWKNTPESYGPLWVLIGSIHTFFFKNSLALTSFFHKLFLLVFLLLSGSVFHKLCRKIIPEQTENTTLAFLLNPLILIVTLADGHNEIVMIFFMLCALYLLIKDRYIYAIAVLALAINVKFVYLAALPFFIIYILIKNGPRNIVMSIYNIFIGGVISFLISALLWFPFGIRSLGEVYRYYNNLSRLFWTDSIPYAFYFLSDRIGLAVSKQVVAHVFLIIFAVIYICMLVYFIKKAGISKEAMFTSLSLVFIALLVTNSTSFQAWYLLWVIPFIYLSNIRLKYNLVFLISYFFIMTFWKRMCVLAMPMLTIYFSMLIFDRKRRIDDAGFKNA